MKFLFFCYPLISRILALAFPILLNLFFPQTGQAQNTFINGSVSSSGDGSINAPFKTIQEALNVAQAGDTLTISPGQYAETLHTSQSGRSDARITVIAAVPGTVVINQVGRVLDVTHPFYTIEGLIFDGGFGENDIVRVRTQADYLEFLNNVVRNGARDGMDLGTNLASRLPNDFLDGVVIEGCEIHHLLWHDGVRKDAHGIVAGGVRQFVIRDSEVYFVSGDALQLQDGGWDEVLVEDVTFWNGPLPNPISGFPAGLQPGENAIDTKQDNRIPYRGRLTIHGGNFYGWQSDLITNAAALNLKERVQVLVDSASVHDNNIGFRLRGKTGDNGAYVTAQNTVFYNNQTAVRYEDRINNLHVYNNTWGLGNSQAFQSAGGTGTGFEVQNNLFLNQSIPKEASAKSNLAVAENEIQNPATHDYHLREGSLAIGSGVLVKEVEHDKDGINRVLPYDIGAYVYTVTAQNMIPIAKDDMTSTSENTPISIAVLSNDSDGDGDTLKIVSVTQGAQGEVAINGNSVIYTPQASLTGTDAFTYSIKDGRGGTATASVMIVVTATISNINPTAVDDEAATPHNTPVSIAILSNDSDDDGDTLKIASVTQGAQGEVTINGNSVIYTPQASLTGTDAFTYSINDGRGGTATATVTISVEGAKPVLLSIEAEEGQHNVSLGSHRWIVVRDEAYSNSQAIEASPNKGTSFTRQGYSKLSPQLNFSIMFPQPGLYYVWVRGYGSSGGNDSAHVGVNGQENKASSEIQIHRSTLDWSRQTMRKRDATINIPLAGEHTVNVWMREDGAIIDKLVLTTDETYVPIGTGPNQTIQTLNAVPVADQDTASTPENTLVTLDVLANDHDADGDGLTITLVTQGTQGSVTTDGVTITYTPRLAFTGTDNFTYSIHDGQGGRATAPVTVTVNGSEPIAFAIEAEHAHSNIPQGNHRWIIISDEAYSNSQAMEASPNKGTSFTRQGYSKLSPQLNFSIMFPQPGLYYVWVRGYGSSGGNDSAHVGVNGQENKASSEIQIHRSTLDWSRQTMRKRDATINIPSAGEHTVNVWMREDGAVIDKLVLTTDANFVPTGVGPDETASGSEN